MELVGSSPSLLSLLHTPWWLVLVVLKIVTSLCFLSFKSRSFTYETPKVRYSVTTESNLATCLHGLLFSPEDGNISKYLTHYTVSLLGREYTLPMDTHCLWMASSTLTSCHMHSCFLSLSLFAPSDCYWWGWREYVQGWEEWEGRRLT
jgi:hypothetical protein